MGRAEQRTYIRADSVSFRKTDEEFGGLSNMAGGFPLEINGERIRTSEALYQACRFPHLPDVQRIIISEKSPMTAKMKSKPFRGQSRSDWVRVRVKIMRWCLRVKLAQNWETFGRLLLGTGDGPIVEDSRKDDFWGAKPAEEDVLIGNNVLGRLLMELREALRGPDRDQLCRVEPPSIPQFLLFNEPIGAVEARRRTNAPPRSSGTGYIAGSKPLTVKSTHVPSASGVIAATSGEKSSDRSIELPVAPRCWPKRLIEVDLPIKRISAHARREKSIRPGHISTLHIWWARRPLASCRAVICATLWPDPADALCPESFRKIAREEMAKWALDHVKLLGLESQERFLTLRKEPGKILDNTELRRALLDFIADFANWDNSTVPAYLETSRALTQAAHEGLGGEPGTRPLVVDPFAGGGSIPLEALRVGADAFASDLNPVAVLLNKVVLEYIPKYGERLADEIRKWGEWVKREVEKELTDLYPKDPDGAAPIAYLWARTIHCEGPGCGAQVPLIGRTVIAQRKQGGVGIAFRSSDGSKGVAISLVEADDQSIAKATCRGFVATCPLPGCGFSTPKKSVQRQLSAQNGGADNSRLVAVLTTGPSGRRYREPGPLDEMAVMASKAALQKIVNAARSSSSVIPDEQVPQKGAHRAVGSQLPLYGFSTWGSLFTARQQVTILALQRAVRRAYELLPTALDEHFARAVFLTLAFAVDKQADYSSSLCRWVPSGEFIAGTLAGEKKLPMISDYAESVPLGSGSGSWDNQIDWIARLISREATASSQTGTICQSSAEECPLPSCAASALITDPPYYDSVPYADLSDYFYVWLKRTTHGIERLENLRKDREMTVNHPDSQEEKERYEELLTQAFSKGRDFTAFSGIAVIVFAHKSTSGWEALLEAIINSGWIVTASWPIDTERAARPNALKTASLASSVHIVCRPRENTAAGAGNEVGDWRNVLNELPSRIHEWMPRLAEEGVVGADAIFACLGPALEIFSRYSRVEKASGEPVTLGEYLVQVWAAVANEALALVFRGADASGFEEDARLTAMWLWALSANRNGTTAEDGTGGDPEAGDDSEDVTPAISTGYALEYDAARKIAQGLGAHLEALTSLVEVKGDTARLLPVAERTRRLFGKDEDGPAASKPRKKKDPQLKLGFVAELERAEGAGSWGVKGAPTLGATVLDRVHQAMILFAAGRSEAIKQFLIDEGVGRDDRFWRLAQALSALYPAGSDEKRWVDGVLARKKGLGL